MVADHSRVVRQRPVSRFLRRKKVTAKRPKVTVVAENKGPKIPVLLLSAVRKKSLLG